MKVVMGIIQYGKYCCYLSQLSASKIRMWFCIMTELPSQNPVHKNASEIPCSARGLYPPLSDF